MSAIVETSTAETNPLPCARKPRQNVAMQAIMRRAETEQKQVTFKNVSPVIVEEESDKKAKSLTIPSTSTNVANKQTPTSEMFKPNEVLTTNTLVTIQSRAPAMSLASPATAHSPSTSVQNQQRIPKLPPNIPMPAQINQLAAKDQPTQVAQQMLSQMHTGMAHCGQQTQQMSSLGPVCYPNQSFNVQNPQFVKNLMASRPPAASSPRYSLQGQQLSNGQQPSAISQAIGVHHTINQSRSLHQRIPQNVSNPAQLLQQQNVRLSSPVQPSMMSQSLNLQTGNVKLQLGMSVDQQSHAMGLQSQQSMIQNNVRPANSMHNQLSMGGATTMAANVSMLPTTLSAYKNDSVQQQVITTLANSPNLTNAASNFQLNFNQINFSQSPFGGQPLQQNQPSPSFYKKNNDIDFPFPNQVNVTKNQPQQQQPPTNNYNMFCSYEPMEQFNLWKDTRPPQPPIAWWGSTGNTAQMHMKEPSAVDNTFSNWGDSSNPGNMASRMPLTPGKNYHQQQNVQHSGHLATGNNFENTRLFDVSII